MARGIIITGPAGSGKSTLGRIVAEALSIPYFDIDDFLWRWDTPQPYTVMRTREEKIAGLMDAIAPHAHFCMGGSMSSFHEHFDPFFDLSVLLMCDPAIRTERLAARSVQRFGPRALPGGDLYEAEKRFRESAGDYETGAKSPNLQEHTAWLQSLPCPMLRLNGALPPEHNCALIVDAWKNR